MLLLWFYILAYIFVIGLCLNKKKTDKGIEQTNTIIRDEIRKRVQEEKKKKQEKVVLIAKVANGKLPPL